MIDIPASALVTPLARQAAMERNVELRPQSTTIEHIPREGSGTGYSSTPTAQKTIAIGADHGGYELKESLKRSLAEWGYETVDCGTDSSESVDYPDYAFAVAQMVANGSASLGVMIDGAGIGSCMAANKVPGVRAGMCYDQATAINSREHNNANVLTLGAGMIGGGLARSILNTWLETTFAGGRHAKRVNKISDIERRYLRSAVPAQG
jgi:ribose 5-phosphate isomerase B